MYGVNFRRRPNRRKPRAQKQQPLRITEIRIELPEDHPIAKLLREERPFAVQRPAPREPDSNTARFVIQQKGELPWREWSARDYG